MIRVTIKQTKSVTENEIKQFTVTKKPTAQKDRYDGVLMEETYENKSVPVSKSVEFTLLDQQIEDAEFDLRTVIAAINKLDGAK